MVGRCSQKVISSSRPRGERICKGPLEVTRVRSGSSLQFNLVCTYCGQVDSDSPTEPIPEDDRRAHATTERSSGRNRQYQRDAAGSSRSYGYLRTWDPSTD